MGEPDYLSTKVVVDSNSRGLINTPRRRHSGTYTYVDLHLRARISYVDVRYKRFRYRKLPRYICSWLTVLVKFGSFF